MKIFFVIALDLVLVLGFFLFEHQKNKDLTRHLSQVESNIDSKKDLQLAIQNFKSQQQQVLLQNKSVVEAEAPKYQAVDFLVTLVNDLPAGIYLTELTTLDRTFWVTGKANSEEALATFVNLRHLKLLESKRLSFKVSGSL